MCVLGVYLRVCLVCVSWLWVLHVSCVYACVGTLHVCLVCEWVLHVGLVCGSCVCVCVCLACGCGVCALCVGLGGLREWVSPAGLGCVYCVAVLCISVVCECTRKAHTQIHTQDLHTRHIHTPH